jgi:hypothetical protein
MTDPMKRMEEKVVSILYPLAEKIHNITHSYMNKEMYAADCRNRQIDELNKTAKILTADLLTLICEVEEGAMPKKLRNMNCGKHKKSCPWSCPDCASFFTHNATIQEIREKIT